MSASSVLPNRNCSACSHRHQPEGGWCYMFEDEPHEAYCGQFKSEPEDWQPYTEAEANEHSQAESLVRLQFHLGEETAHLDKGEEREE